MAEGKMLVKCIPCWQRNANLPGLSIDDAKNHLRHGHPEFELKHKDDKEVLKYVQFADIAIRK